VDPTPAATAWAQTARTALAELDAAAGRADWPAACTLAARLARCLEAPPASSSAKVDVYREARLLLARLGAEVLRAREHTAAELRRTVRGRKAVSAYS
jgi:hypothetical protein